MNGNTTEFTEQECTKRGKRKTGGSDRIRSIETPDFQTFQSSWTKPLQGHMIPRTRLHNRSLRYVGTRLGTENKKLLLKTKTLLMTWNMVISMIND